MGAGSGVSFGDSHFAALAACPGRDSVAPPDLAADAPVADIIQPVIPGFEPVFRKQPRLGGDGGAGSGSQFCGGYKPLARNIRLHYCLAAVAAANCMG